MITTNGAAGGSWPGLIRETLAGCWQRLLAMQVLFAAAYLGADQVRVPLVRSEHLALAAIWHLVATTLLLAWNWSTALRIMGAGQGLPGALRIEPRRTARLGGWIVALSFTDLIGLLVYVSPGGYTDFVFSPANTLAKLLTAYLAFAGALLPMVILREGGGFRRAWDLTHTSWPTALRVLGTVAVGSLALLLARHFQIQAIGHYPETADATLHKTLARVIENARRLFLFVLLYTAYRLAPTRSRGHSKPEAEPEPTPGPAPAPAA